MTFTDDDGISRLPYGPNPDEVATIVAAGHSFEDWESVFVQHRWTDAFAWFRFTSAERESVPPSFDWHTLRLKPPDPVTIYLGGQLAINGLIVSRQTAYEGRNHAVQLEGRGLTWAASTSSILDKTSEYDGLTFEQVARRVMAPTGVGIQVIGKLDANPFVKLHNEVGETIWAFLERISRPRGIVLGSDHLGNLLLVGDHNYPVSARLIEGENILKMQCVISKEYARTKFMMRGQTARSDQGSPADAAQQEASAPGSWPTYRPLLAAAEQPVWNLAELAERAKNEAVWGEGNEINVVVTVQGWKPVPGGPLWQAGSKVSVYSPMAMLDMELKIQTATFTQDRNQGTLTTLELVAPWLLKDSYRYSVGSSPPPGDAKPAPTTEPATTPPAAKVPDAPPEILE